jgi:REP element-mobilizing transposase RayT
LLVFTKETKRNEVIFMAREKRICEPLRSYHCCSRCIEARCLLSDDFVKAIAVEVIKKAVKMYHFEIIQMEFVGNHFHFIFRTLEGGGTISQIMQYVKSRIAILYNRKVGRIGPFWNERFKSKIIEYADDPKKYFMHVMWYIGYNPVRKKIIRDPRESKYGTIRAYFEQDFVPKVPVTFHEYFLELGNSFSERAKKFLEYEVIYRQGLAI